MEDTSSKIGEQNPPSGKGLYRSSSAVEGSNIHAQLGSGLSVRIGREMREGGERIESYMSGFRVKLMMSAHVVHGLAPLFFGMEGGKEPDRIPSVAFVRCRPHRCPTLS